MSDSAALQSMIGAYGPWAASLVGDGPGEYSFRNPRWTDLEEWRAAASRRLAERLAAPDIPGVPQATVERRGTYDGLQWEELFWQLPYGPPPRAVFLKPEGSTGRLPGILALHDHGGQKVFGVEKIAQVEPTVHPVMAEHRADGYEGVAWANEIAKRGYAVLVSDAFPFASRRVRLSDVPERMRRGLSDPDLSDPEQIAAYNNWAADHESIMAKSLFSAGTTWPGVFVAEDRAALAVLCARDDVDPDRVGCGGLSGGGLRTVFLGGTDPRIRCAVCVGMMTTWRDYLLHKSWTHTWMVYVPLLPRELAYPEILGLRVPLPTLVQSCTEDPLFTVPEMRRADDMLRAIWDKTGAPDRYRSSFHPGSHKFDLAMQSEAFDWFDQWLNG